jgi:hypothetical protein
VIGWRPSEWRQERAEFFFGADVIFSLLNLITASLIPDESATRLNQHVLVKENVFGARCQ